MKKQRQELILSFVKNGEISTQEDILNSLRGQGFDVTQATVSRDIKELGLVKSMDSEGRYRYYLPKAVMNDGASALNSIFLHSVLSLDRAANTVVLKCLSGMAQGVCASVDSVSFDEIVGTIAGDDTIFVLCRTEDAAIELLRKFSDILS